MHKSQWSMFLAASIVLLAGLGAGGHGTVSVPQPPARTLSPSLSSIAPIPYNQYQATTAAPEHALLLFDSSTPLDQDENVCTIVEYYGQECARIAIDQIDLSADSLRDAQGNYYRFIAISADTLSAHPSLLTANELDILESAVEQGGVTLLITKANENTDADLLARLTEGAVVGVTKPDATGGWVVSDVAPEISGVLSGQVFSVQHGQQSDFTLEVAEQASLTPLISALDSSGKQHPVLVSYKRGLGSVFVEAGEACPNLATVPLYNVYYWSRFSQIVPLMVVTRYAFGDSAWHNNHLYANLLIDDPALTEPYDNVSFVALLHEMKTHDFHTTIGFIPARWRESQPEVVSLFRTHPDRLSIVQHGNNHDGYEFYKYSTSPDDKYPARPLVDQKADITEGLSRMVKHFVRTGIPRGRVMVFPWEISPAETFHVLKSLGFLGTINGQIVPLGAAWPPDPDFGMYPAVMDFETFPALLYRHPGTYNPFTADIQLVILDLFIGKPALFHSFWNELFAEGVDSFNPVADQINALHGDVQWDSPEKILRHLYLERANDDGSVDVWMFCSELTVSNESNEDRMYHFSKEESLNVPISSLTANGQSLTYEVNHGFLNFDVTIPGDSAVEIILQYAM